MILSISALDHHIAQRSCRWMITEMICDNLFIIHTRQIVFFEAIKNSELHKSKWYYMEFNCEFNRYSFRTFLPNKSITISINSNGNISYEDILFIYHGSWRGYYPWILFIRYRFTFSVIIIYHLRFNDFFFNMVWRYIVFHVNLIC